NYIDTAFTYMDGQNERIVGEALKGYRDKVYLATKINSKADLLSKEAIHASMDESLRRLGVDGVDVNQLHHPDKEILVQDEPKEALAQIRKAGKARFVGVTAHSDETAVLNAVVDDPDTFYDMVLVTYNYKTPKEQIAAIARCAEADLGVLAMKTQQGGYDTDTMGAVSPHQA
ncbi:MAG: aldo/keto reductase, partial [bacterium]|nr:aldo/keto reductase [bacterium]